MQQEYDNKKISFLVGNNENLKKIDTVKTLPIFSEMVIDFFDLLSKELLAGKKYKVYPDVIAYAFWIRKAALRNNKNKYEEFSNRIGRGIVFQIAPSNIPVQFAVSMTYALISGNISIVRVSNKEFEQVNLICEAINKVLYDFKDGLAQYIYIIRYPHNDDITRFFSLKCDVRMIWGGDSTINMIRRFELPSRSIELCFADRYSIAIIDSDYLLNANLDYVMRDFYLDTYYSDQNACSSSRMIIWTGKSIDKAKGIFWSKINEYVLREYDMPDIQGSEKLLKTALIAAKYDMAREIRVNNKLVRISVDDFDAEIIKYKGECGYFIESDVSDIDEIICLLGNRCQTITYLGDDMLKSKIFNLVYENGTRGVDRIVPMGHSIDLSFCWDGYDMPLVLSRVVSFL